MQNKVIDAKYSHDDIIDAKYSPNDLIGTKFLLVRSNAVNFTLCCRTYNFGPFTRH